MITVEVGNGRVGVTMGVVSCSGSLVMVSGEYRGQFNPFLLNLCQHLHKELLIGGDGGAVNNLFRLHWVYNGGFFGVLVHQQVHVIVPQSREYPNVHGLVRARDPLGVKAPPTAEHRTAYDTERALN